MSRNPRTWYPGAIYHVTARGNRKADIFYDDADFEEYLACILLCQTEVTFHLHAYCLMDNHVHLLIETIHQPLSQIIQFVHTRYAIYFNKRHKVTGHLFQGRYHAALINSNSYLLEASKYIHLNPLHAQMVSKAVAYPWSSYSTYLCPDKEQPVLTKDLILGLFTEPSHKKYQNYVDGKEGVNDGDNSQKHWIERS
ncbi:REP-associated tyrosine transposase [Halobacillus seohaensis]|uniref:Transposase n=1 Tax=Halobacillus seohaensis TaxID=447421 RepID=A0ABW2ERJ5_9BACI